MERNPRRKTLSTSTQESYEVLHNEDFEFTRMEKQVFDKITNYLQCEFSTTLNDYNLLNDINTKVSEKVKSMQDRMKTVASEDSSSDTETYNISTMIKRIDEIEDSIQKIESAAYRLEKYAAKLEEQFKTVFPSSG